MPVVRTVISRPAPTMQSSCSIGTAPMRWRARGRARQHGLAQGSLEEAAGSRRSGPDQGAERRHASSTARLEIGATTPLTEVVNIRWCARSSALLMEAAELVASPQIRNQGTHRRQRVAGHALLVLPRRLDLLPRRRQHLLRRHADGDQPRARDLRRRPLRGGQPVRHRAGARRARRADGDPRAERRARRATPRTTSSAPASTSRG